MNQTYQQDVCIVTLPPFHIAGLAFTVLVPAYYGSIPIYPIAGTPPGLEVFLGALSATEADWAFVSPVLSHLVLEACRVRLFSVEKDDDVVSPPHVGEGVR